MPISLCAHMRQLCKYTFLIWTKCNQQCDQEHWYPYISHYWYMPLKNMPATFHINVSLHCCFSLHIDHKINFTYKLKNNELPTAYMPLKCHICQLVHVYIWHNSVNIYIYIYIYIYISYKLIKSTISPKALVCLHFKFLASAPEEICLSHCICATALIRKVTYKSHITTYVSNNKQSAMYLLC